MYTSLQLCSTVNTNSWETVDTKNIFETEFAYFKQTSYGFLLFDFKPKPMRKYTHR